MNQNKRLGLKVRVKLGMLSITEAMDLCAPQSKTHAWLDRRFKRSVATRKEAASE